VRLRDVLPPAERALPALEVRFIVGLDMDE
jgi:hypothetical protein